MGKGTQDLIKGDGDMPVVLASGRDQYCLLVTAINVALRQPLRSFRKSRKVPCSGSLTFRSCNCQRRYVTISALEAQRATPDSISTRVLMARTRVVRGNEEAAKSIPLRNKAMASRLQQQNRHTVLRRRNDDPDRLLTYGWPAELLPT